MSNESRAFVIDLANKHDLDLFDNQEGKWPGPSGHEKTLLTTASYRFRIVSIHAANDCTNFLKNSRVLSWISLPSASKRLAAPPM